MFLWYSVDYWYIMEVILLMIGGIIISIVISVCGVNFSLMMSDGRMIRYQDVNNIKEPDVIGKRKEQEEGT